MNQHTIASSFEISGIGIHTGKPVTIIVEEAPPDSGVVFKRRDLPGSPVLPASVSKVINVERCTVLGNEKMRVSTAEHFLAALYGMEIDNLTINLDAEELPIVDGSAGAFCESIQKAGIKEQKTTKNKWAVKTPQYVKKGDAMIVALPCDGLKITGVITYSHPMITSQVFETLVTPQSMKEELAPARTYAFWEEVQELWERNLALGGDLDNALIIKEDGFSSPLRFPDEMVRHKCLDLLGDLALLGKALDVHLVSIRAGHSLNIEMMKRLEYVEVRDVRC